MLERLSIYISSTERKALEKSAGSSFRDLREEARFLICEGLKETGYLNENYREKDEIDE